MNDTAVPNLSTNHSYCFVPETKFGVGVYPPSGQLVPVGGFIFYYCTLFGSNLTYAQCNENNQWRPKNPQTVTCGKIGRINSIARAEGDKAVCGQSPVDIDFVPRIYGGNDAGRGDWPWMVQFESFTFCGGSLIHPEWVLTAAHCLRKKDGTVTANFVVVVGYNSRFKQRIRTSEIHIHPRDGKKRRSNDVGLVKLSRPVRLTKTVGIVCLPQPTKTNLLEKGGMMGVLTGWGAIGFRKGTAKVLQMAILPYVSKTVCRKTLHPIYEDEFCAGYEHGNSSSCAGDSGSPLVFPEYDRKSVRRYVLRGILSRGKDARCGRKSYGIYASVDSFMPWIRQVTGLEKF